MSDKQRIGSEIKKLRKRKKFTQAQLAFGICNQSEISRIESGDCYPSIDILHMISIKLQVSISFFFEILVHEDHEKTKYMRNKIETLLLNKRYLEIHQYVENLLSKNNSYHPEIEKFLLWQKFISAYCLGKITHDYCLTELFLLLKNEISGTDLLLNLQIKNSIANILAENKRYSASIKLYNDILNDSEGIKEADKLRIKVLFNSGKLLYLNREFEAALIQANQGIDLSIGLADMSLLGQYYYLKGSIMEELSYSIVEISSTFEKSQLFFNLLNLETHKQILNEKKAKYLIK